MAASLLLLLEEEDAFWMMATIVEDLLPASYYSSTLLGNIRVRSCERLSSYEILLSRRNLYRQSWRWIVISAGIQADQKVLRTLVANYLPDIDHVLVQHDIELSLISLHWFLTLFASVVHMKILLRLWDMFLFDGSIVLFQVTLGMLKIKGVSCHSRSVVASACDRSCLRR